MNLDQSCNVFGACCKCCLLKMKFVRHLTGLKTSFLNKTLSKIEINENIYF